MIWMPIKVADTDLGSSANFCKIRANPESDASPLSCWLLGLYCWSTRLELSVYNKKGYNPWSHFCNKRVTREVMWWILSSNSSFISPCPILSIQCKCDQCWQHECMNACMHVPCFHVRMRKSYISLCKKPARSYLLLFVGIWRSLNRSASLLWWWGWGRNR